MGGQQFPINLSGVLVAAMLVLAALLNQPPLRSDRPPAAKISAEPSGPFQDIPARIWEDPLEAVARGAQTSTAPTSTAVTEPAAAPAPASVGTAAADGSAPGSTSAPPVDPPGDPPGDAPDELAPEPTAEPPVAGAPPNILSLYLRHLPEPGRASRLLIMPVMISGAPHPALREQRLRMRFAVHAGLARGGFLPLRSDRIGNWTWRVDESLPRRQPLVVDVPFEAFKRDRPDSDAWVRDLVLVLWLNDEYVSQDLGRDASGIDPDGRWPGPLAAIDALLGEIDYPVQGDPARAGPWRAGYRSTAVRVLGPASSDSLEPVYVELQGRAGSDCNRPYRHLNNAPGEQSSGAGAAADGDPFNRIWGDRPINFALISPLATAPQRDLVGPPTIGDGAMRIGGADAVDASGAPCPTLALYRTVTADDRMIAAVIDELQRRGVDPVGGTGHAGWLPGLLATLNPGATDGGPASAAPARDHVVLISEWDTKFGRTLPTLFERQVRAGASPPLPNDAPVPWLHRYAYVRGLDGDTPAAPGGGGAAGRPDLLALASGDDAGFKEPAAGANQYDYLRRMTEHLAELDWSLKRDNQGSIKAFAILGNDYFDKLLILQALKERFPGHLYLTTDLDAGLLDAKVFRWTRNLVVAAPYGLTLLPDLQGLTPPLRHSYQTSLYLSVLRTVQGLEAELSQRAASDPPLRFEVGYGRFYQLQTSAPKPEQSAGQLPTAAGDPDRVTATPATADLPAPIHHGPTRTGAPAFLASHAGSLALAILLAIAGLLLATNWQPRRRAPTPGSTMAARVEAHAEWLLTLCYLVVGGGWLAWAIGRGEEPFAWFGGVSIWPSEIIRLFAGWVAGLCLIYGWRRVRDAERRIAGVFDLPAPEPVPVPGGRPPRERFRDWYRGRPPLSLPLADQGQGAPADDRAPPPHGAAPNDPAPDSVPDTVPGPPGVRPLAERICRLFADSSRNSLANSGEAAETAAPPTPTIDATAEWLRYLPQASLRARLGRVLPPALLFWLFSIIVVYGFVDPLSPHRGLAAYLFDTLAGLLLVGLPFIVLLFAVVDEAHLCRGLLRRLDRAPVRWPVATARARCTVDAPARRAVDYWIAIEFIAERSAPAGHIVHLPLLVTLFLLLSFSTRFDNWNTPASVLGLIALTVGIVLIASNRLRNTAQGIRARLVDDLKEEVSGIEYAAAKNGSERLRQLVARIEAIHEGAYTKWYNEPVFRALAWVLGIGIWIVTEYANVGA